MFITKTMNESAGLDVPNMSLDQYMVESACEAYEDLINLNEALAHFDIKEQELICTESVELDAFREEAMDKAKTFLKDLVAKIKAKWNQFINFVLKKVAESNKKNADKFNAAMNGVPASALIKVIDEKDLKIKYFAKVSKFSNCVNDISDYMTQAFKAIDSEKDLANFKPADFFKEVVGEAKEARKVSGRELLDTWKSLSDGSAMVKKAEKSLEVAIENAGKAGSGDEKEAARRVTLVNLKGQQVVKVALTAYNTVASKCGYAILGCLNAYRKELKKHEDDEK
jgi:hypothetical protein|nr:MAG TPA: hypothetical protein [Caudoviricetes sp.]